MDTIDCLSCYDRCTNRVVGIGGIAAPFAAISVSSSNNGADDQHIGIAMGDLMVLGFIMEKSLISMANIMLLHIIDKNPSRPSLIGTNMEFEELGCDEMLEKTAR